MSTDDDRRLWPGTEPPASGSPKRRRGSVRRTTIVDMVRPEGLAGPLVIAGTGRDLATGIDDEPYLIDAGATSVTVAPGPGHTITAVEADAATGRPSPEVLDGLVGLRAGSGFRRALAAAAPDLVESGSLVHLLLDETPPACLIAGSVLLRVGLLGGLDRALPVAAGGEASSPGAPRRRLPVDICAGWAADGSIVRAVAETGNPILGWGPPAPDLHTAADGPSDELAWHPSDPLPPHAMRRRRLIDLWRGVGPDGRSATAPLRVAIRFRDTYSEAAAPTEGDGATSGSTTATTETVVHEYGLTARVDLATWTVLEASATPGPLPAPECPSAAASASRLVGHPVAGLRTLVRDEFAGPSTCTHLNDLFRSLADVRHLWESAAMARGERP